MKQYIIKNKPLVLRLTALVLVLAAVVGIVLLRQSQLRRQQQALQEALSRAEAQLAADRASLSRALQGLWSRPVEGEGRNREELYITEDTIEYRFASQRHPELDQTLYTYRWTAEDAATLRIFYPEGGESLITAQILPALGETPETLRLTPSLTSMGEEESWERREP